MKLTTARNKVNEEFIGVVSEDHTTLIHLKKLGEKLGTPNKLPETMLEAIEFGDEFLQIANQLVYEGAIQGAINDCVYKMDEVELLAPIPRTKKNVFCVGKNYYEHVKEMGGDEAPEHLILFTKAPTTIIGPDKEIPSHQEVTDCLDYEGELAIVIGKKGKNISNSDALDYVFGYTILNDISARDLQSRHKQYFLGKSLDDTCPIGPWIVDKSEIANPNELKIETRVNGEVRQSASTNLMIFPIEEIIATISQGMTLEPGDIIATGTPSGVGKGFNPPKYLKSGDRIEISIEGIGTLRNTVK